MTMNWTASRLADPGEGADGVDMAGAALRVMLVGRTALDATLRRDPGFELYRPRGATDAIGELSEVMRPGENRATLVLVSEGAVEAGRTTAFVAALRRIDAQAKVVAVSTGRNVPEGFDGVIAPSADPATVRGLVFPATARRAPEAPNAANAASPSASASGGVQVVSRPVNPSELPSAGRSTARTAPDVHQHTPLGAILAGKDPVEAALASLRALHGRQIRFVASGSAGGEAIGSLDAEPGGVPVAHGERVFGRLLADGIAPEALAKDGAWLAGWMALALQQDQLRRAAFTDELTGAWNRRYFQRYLGAAIDQARSLRRTLSLLMFDIDNFKQYNDRHGHSAGDEILVESVRLLKGIVRPSDRVCRVGGDEFAVIFYDPEGPRNPSVPQSAVGLQSIADVARRFQRQICEHRFPKLGDQAPGSLSISGGMATFPWDAQTASDLVERADALSMTSKRQGKNAIVIGPGAERACETGIADA